MKVFISWSGARSRIVAEALRSWLPDIINAVEPFVSELDIDKGAVGTEVIARQLKDSAFGIVCLTRDNQTRPWINYEAGALSKVVGDDEARVATVLIDIDGPAGVTGPLRAFQATRLYDPVAIRQLVASIAKAAGDVRSREKLDALVDKLWESLASQVTKENLDASGETSAAPTRQPEDMFAEILTLVRQLSQDISRFKPDPSSSKSVQSAKDLTYRAAAEMERLINEQGLRLSHWSTVGDKITLRLAPDSKMPLSTYNVIQGFAEALRLSPVTIIGTLESDEGSSESDLPGGALDS